MGYQERQREAFAHKAVAGILALITAAVLSWSAGFGVFYTFFS